MSHATQSGSAPVIAGPSLQVKTDRADALEEQRKVITVVFIDLTGSTATAERFDPEEWRGVLQRYFAVLSNQIERFGGTIDKYIGDAVMAVFGAPIAREDDPHRAISAALAIKAEMAKENEELERRFGVRLNLRTGINSGEVVAGLLVGGAEGAYTVTGDTVNTAQRLESAAPPNEILVGESTYQLARRAFVFETLPPLTLKGKKEPVPAYRVIMPERRAVPREHRPPFVGRAAELAKLHALFEEATAGHGRVLHIHGEAGVGKSRLVDEFFAFLSAGTRRLRPRCSSFESGAPYALVADLLRRAFGIQRTEEESVAREALSAGLGGLSLPTDEGTVVLLLEVLGYSVRSPLDPQNKRRVLLSLVRRFLREQSARSPTVVVIEDLHWIDAASAGLFAEALADVPSLACLVASASRDEVLPWPAERIELAPLDESSSADLLDRLAATPLDADTRAAVLSRTAGNPFFLEEVVRSLGGRATGKVPATVQELLQARIDGLEPEAKRVAQRAAVIGRTFATSVLARVSGDVALDRALAVLEAEGFVARRPAAPEPTYAFRHALLQEAAYQIQLVSRRRSLHGAVGGAVEALYAGRLEEFVDVLAFQYGRSELDDKAVQWNLRAGDRAKALFANEDAIRLYTTALERAKDGEGAEQAGGILEPIGDVRMLVGRYDEAIETFKTARERAPAISPTSDARLHRKVGQALRWKGAYDEALASFEAARAALLGQEVGEAGWIEMAIGHLHKYRGDFAKVREPMQRAIEIARQVGDEELLADGLQQLANVAYLAGDAREAVRLYQESRAMFERLEHLHAIAIVRSNLTAAYNRLGRYQEALAEIAATLPLYERIGNPWGLGNAHNNLGDAHRELGDLDRSIAAYRRAMEIWGAAGYTAGVALALIGLGDAYVRAHEIEKGKACLLDAEARYVALGTKAYLPDLYRFLASAELAAGDLDAAEHAAQRSLEFARAAATRHQEAMTERVLGEVAMRRGDARRARELLEESRRTLAELGEEAELARTEAVLNALAVA